MDDPVSKTININTMPEAHSNLRADDWRSPLVRRLIGCDTYADGSAIVTCCYAGQAESTPSNHPVTIQWSGLASDFGKVIKTYQAPVITEMATLGLACGMISAFTQMEVTEVTRRGESADYWLGDRELMLEVSGQESGDLEALCQEKSTQLQDNPYGKDGFVCVANYSDAEARLWYYAAPTHDEAESSDE
jgi:hypothetical protein